MVSWQFLLFGTLGAVGAAMALGTVAALARYRRTGTFPGHEPGDGATMSKGQIRGLYVRIVLGFVLLAVSLGALRSAGLL